MRRNSLICWGLMLFAGWSGVAESAVISVSFDEINGPSLSTGFPTSSVSVDTETFMIPGGHTIMSATLSGTYGITSVFSAGSSAHNELYINGILVLDSTDLPDDIFFSVVGGYPFSVTLSPAALATLTSESAELSYIQTGPFVVRLSVSTLEITTAGVSVVPEPASITLLGLGIAGFAAREIRRRRVMMTLA